MSDIEVTKRVGTGHGTRIGVELFDMGWTHADKFLERLAEAMAAIEAEGVPRDDIMIDLDAREDRWGSEVVVDIYGHRPTTKAERSKVSRQQRAEQKRQADWHRARLAELEGEK